MISLTYTYILTYMGLKHPKLFLETFRQTGDWRAPLKQYLMYILMGVQESIAVLPKQKLKVHKNMDILPIFNSIF